MELIFMLLRVCMATFTAVLLVGCAPRNDLSSQNVAAKTDASKQLDAPEQSGTREAVELAVFAWNVESGGADPKRIAERLASYDDHNILCLSEVHPNDFATFRQALGEDFASFESRSGNEDRLQILYDKTRFELLEQIELDRHGDYVLNNGGHRSPTAVRLKDRVSDKTFIVMVNHLARGNAEFRKQQAIGLREWARDQDTAIINVGDFNMDYEFATGKGNDALDEIRRDNVWKWVEPVTWIDTNWWDPEGDGLDNFEGSLLDFAFVAGPAKDWETRCEVIVELNDFPDDEMTSDHRPISLKLKLAP
jgi:endonuclease/exonuclease/phosphatase family metal-dependent hydrolase